MRSARTGTIEMCGEAGVGAALASCPTTLCWPDGGIVAGALGTGGGAELIAIGRDPDTFCFGGKRSAFTGRRAVSYGLGGFVGRPAAGREMQLISGQLALI